MNSYLYNLMEKARDEQVEVTPVRQANMEWALAFAFNESMRVWINTNLSPIHLQMQRSTGTGNTSIWLVTMR